jgi:hypothetical protein
LVQIKIYGSACVIAEEGFKIVLRTAPSALVLIGAEAFRAFVVAGLAFA